MIAQLSPHISKKSSTLTQSFAGGVLMTPPHSGSLEGKSFHNFEMKYALRVLHGDHGCIRLLEQEHQALYNALTKMGIPITSITPEVRHADDTFVCDSTSIARNGGEMMIIGLNMGEKSRRDETKGVLGEIHKLLPNQNTEMISHPAKFEAGDLLPLFLGQNAEFCLLAMGKRNRSMSPTGLSVRTNSEGRKAVSDLYHSFYREGYLGALSIPHTKLHLGTACEIIQVGSGEDIIVIHNEGLLSPKKTCEALKEKTKKVCPNLKFRSLNVPLKESWAAPVLSHNGYVIVDERFEKTIKKLASIGFKVLPVPGIMHQALDGNFRCKIQPFVSQN